MLPAQEEDVPRTLQDSKMLLVLMGLYTLGLIGGICIADNHFWLGIGVSSVAGFISAMYDKD